MTEEKSIVVGCDDKLALSAIMDSMKELNTFSYNIVSATRVSDLISIAKSLDPDLIILCFRNNQLTLNDCFLFIKKPEIPILCLTRKNESTNLNWHKNAIVFTCPLEHVDSNEFLNARIHSIFLLGNETPQKTNPIAISRSTSSSGKPANNRHLSRYVMELDQKLELLSKVKNRISELFPQVDDHTRTELTSIVNAIKVSVNDSKLWDDFKVYFEETNPNFLQLLTQLHPNLTAKDLKYCCYLKMNMTNDDIRNLLGINQESVRTHKHRLKKKMAISKEQDLRNYLLSLEQVEYQFA